LYCLSTSRNHAVPDEEKFRSHQAARARHFDAASSVQHKISEWTNLTKSAGRISCNHAYEMHACVNYASTYVGQLCLLVFSAFQLASNQAGLLLQPEGWPTLCVGLLSIPAGQQPSWSFVSTLWLANILCWSSQHSSWPDKPSGLLFQPEGWPTSWLVFQQPSWPETKLLDFVSAPKSG
jgi:hypothetical protein